jgi:hypothetical protein
MIPSDRFERYNPLDHGIRQTVRQSSLSQARSRPVSVMMSCEKVQWPDSKETGEVSQPAESLNPSYSRSILGGNARHRRKEEGMPLEFVHGFLGISADPYPDGRFSVLGGGFDAVEVPSFPAFILSLVIVARVRAPTAEADRPHLVQVRLYNPDGTLMRECGTTTVDVRDRPGPRIGPFERGMISNIIINLYGITFPVGGAYRVDFLEGDAVFGTMTIPVMDALTIHGG